MQLLTCTLHMMNSKLPLSSVCTYRHLRKSLGPLDLPICLLIPRSSSLFPYRSTYSAQTPLTRPPQCVPRSRHQTRTQRVVDSVVNGSWDDIGLEGLRSVREVWAWQPGRADSGNEMDDGIMLLWWRDGWLRARRFDSRS